jgi:ubiquinone/menaquinone biosynthesis C-methylase UbiE
MRKYRVDITNMGQSSPLELNKYVETLLDNLNLDKKSIICDIGCGIGKQCEILKNKFDCRFYGIDFSPATVSYLKDKNIFDEVFLASSDTLPIGTKSCEVAISMENLEHLYEEQVLNALKELIRVSNHVIITTPRPQDCMYMPWLSYEILEATNDHIPLNERDYICLESCVHKSIVFPKSMKKCGFNVAVWSGLSMVYYGKSSEINLEHLEFIGINKTELNTRKNYVSFKEKYLTLLHECLEVNKDILHKCQHDDSWSVNDLKTII